MLPRNNFKIKVKLSLKNKANEGFKNQKQKNKPCHDVIDFKLF